MSFSIALSGLQSASQDLSVISNNIANASTFGFKKSRAEFGDVYQTSGAGNAVGSGVQSLSVSQDFGQGPQKNTGRNLDLRINGNGFFRISDGGALKYTRAGAFHLDKDGFIVNSLDDNLTGFVVDENGALTGALGDLQITTANQQPQATSAITLEMNLDAEADVPTVEFQRGFTATTPPNPSSYNKLENTVIYDSLGTSHILSKYFVKTNIDNRWDVYVGIDGNDVTPAAAAAPTISITAPATPPGNLPGSNPIPAPTAADWSNYSPFTVVFDNQGKFIQNDPNTPPQLVQTPIAYSPATNAYDGTNPPGSENLTLSPPLNNPWKMTALVTDPTTLKKPNGNNIAVEIRNASGGFTSTNVDAAVAGNATARKIADAINGTAALSTQVEAFAYTEFELGEFFPGAAATFTLTAEGTNTTAASPISISAAATYGDVVTAINATTATTGVRAVARDIAGDTASATRKRIVLISDGYDSVGTALGAGVMQASGHNITLSMTNTSVTPLFQNFDTATTGLSLTQRGAVTVRALTVSGEFRFSGSEASAMGFETGRIYDAVVDQKNSDVITVNWTPTTAGPATQPVDPQSITLNMNTSTQFGDPFAVTDKNQDGFTTGRLSGIEVDTTGTIFARYTNGQSSTLGRVALVNFPSENGLTPVGNTQWVESFGSGQPLIGEPQTANFGSIEALTLEDSNVDLTQELVSMIIAQRNFQANAQTIRTSDQVTQTIINIR